MKALNSVFARAVKSVPAAHPVGGRSNPERTFTVERRGSHTRKNRESFRGINPGKEVLIWDEEDRCLVQVVDHQKHWQKS